MDKILSDLVNQANKYSDTINQEVGKLKNISASNIGSSNHHKIIDNIIDYQVKLENILKEISVIMDHSKTLLNM